MTIQPRRLSGIQPSGNLHLGNYFGAIRPHIKTQDNSLYFIADYHALTTLRDPESLKMHTSDVALTYLALGLDPERAILFRQSDVPEVTELMWLLMTVTGMGLLERAVSYKEKRQAGIAATAGLLMYPALMAADILAYESDVVPVGSDQVQHVEIARDMAQSFNAIFGDTFKIPQFELGIPIPVPGVDGRKMSKSYKNTIPIFAGSAELKAAVLAIKTDSTPLDAPKNPDTCTVFRLYSLVGTSNQVDEMRANYLRGGYGYGHAKQELIQVLSDYFADARVRYDCLRQDRSLVEATLRKGAERARDIAASVTHRARSAVGIGRILSQVSIPSK